jgi:hypothetical protein
MVRCLEKSPACTIKRMPFLNRHRDKSIYIFLSAINRQHVKRICIFYDVIDPHREKETRDQNDARGSME